MSLLDQLDRKFGRYAVPNVTLAVVFFQGLAWLLQQARPELLERLLLTRDGVLAGEWWRLFSFIVIPPNTNALFLFFGLYFFYLMGTTLESNWGTFRFNIYLLIAYLATVATVFLVPLVFDVPFSVATNSYIGGSVFLAFAYLYPDFTILLFFILPVKVKWIALLTWILYVVQFATGDWLTRAMIVAAVLNFLLFFGEEIFRHARYGRKRMVMQMRELREQDRPFNTCVICGVTEKSNPKMEFRYCPLCVGTPCYCIDHIGTHAHRVVNAP